MGDAERERDDARHPRRPARRQIVEHAVEGGADALLAIHHDVVDDGTVDLLPTLVLIALQHRAEEIELGQDVAEPSRDHLLAFQRAAHRQKREIGDQRKGRGIARKPLPVMRHAHILRRRCEQRARPAAQECTPGIGHRMTGMRPEAAVERVETLVLVCLRKRLKFLQHIGMRADRALAEDHQVAGEDIGAFHGDADRHGAILPAEIVARTVDDRLAAVDVHRLFDRLTHALRGVIFHDRRDHRRLLATVERRNRQPARSVNEIGVGGKIGEVHADALEYADRHVELAAHAGIGAGRPGAHRRRSRRLRRQRDAAAGRQRRHQHLPALPDLLFAAQYPVERNEDVLAVERSVLEMGELRDMAFAVAYARRRGRQQCDGNAALLLAAEQPFGIV